MPASRTVVWGLALGLSLWFGCQSENVEEVGLDSGGTQAIDFGECVAGEPLPCTCANGGSGTQLCLDSGLERGPCICEDSPMPPATTDAPPPMESSEGSSSGGDEGTTGTGSSESSSSGSALDSSDGG
ncbi:MAG: hypothetical protein AAF799_03485 [Myxococcota bacterium]